MKDMTVLDETLSLNSALSEDKLSDLNTLANVIIASMK
jgi:hypothetical protein